MSEVPPLDYPTNNGKLLLDQILSHEKKGQTLARFSSLRALSNSPSR